jgi:CheY-like chemotaxis protein|nr:response regulator [Candidatus Krumholzibacteria bacterium]
MAGILVIEDDPQVREFLTELLRREGHLVTEAADGRQGIHAYRNNEIDLIITDLFMPVKEGLETIIDLRKEYPDLKIIAISGGNRDGKGDYLRAAQLCGAQHIFHKPFEKNALLAAVNQLLAIP